MKKQNDLYSEKEANARFEIAVKEAISSRWMGEYFGFWNGYRFKRHAVEDQIQDKRKRRNTLRYSYVRQLPV
jgi:hypothetical protein